MARKEGHNINNTIKQIAQTHCVYERLDTINEMEMGKNVEILFFFGGACMQNAGGHSNIVCVCLTFRIFD